MSWDNRAEGYAKKNMKSVITNDAKDAYTIGVVDGQRFARKELLSSDVVEEVALALMDTDKNLNREQCEELALIALTAAKNSRT